jgi:hypothetical protein
MAKQAKNRGAGHAPFVAQIISGQTEFSLVLADYNNVTASWTVPLLSGDRSTVTAWIWVSKAGESFVRVQSRSFASDWDDEACPDINAFLLGGGQEVQAFAELRNDQGELLLRSAVFSGTYSPS